MRSSTQRLVSTPSTRSARVRKAVCPASSIASRTPASLAIARTRQTIARSVHSRTRQRVVTGKSPCMFCDGCAGREVIPQTNMLLEGRIMLCAKSPFGVLGSHQTSIRVSLDSGSSGETMFKPNTTFRSTDKQSLSVSTHMYNQCGMHCLWGKRA